MAIFSRRTLQRLINENAEFLSGRQIKDHVNKLNNKDINVEWEIVLLNVFSKLGKVEHEKQFNGKKPDLHFVSTNGKVEFLADIKTVSDSGIEIKNPFDQLNERLQQEVLKYDIKGAWGIYIGGDQEEARRHGRMVQMKLPALARFDKEIFNEKFEDFAACIKANPSEPRRFEIRNSSTELTFTYNPSARWTGTGSYPGYKSIERREHLIQNSVYSGLVSKADQLRGTGYSGILGIFVCDGGSDFLANSRPIISEFLHNYEFINFVMTIRVNQNFGWRDTNEVLIECMCGGSPLPEVEEFLSRFQLNPTNFPYPQRNGRNAANVLKSAHPERHGSYIGGFTMSSNEITISSRALLELLAGRLSYDDFPEEYKHFFATQLSQGCLFKEFKIQVPENENDDDWLTIVFGEPDAAVSAFVIP
jgi:hypothetical protein